MTVLRDILIDLRDKRLWPVAAVLLAALVAIPLLVSKSTKPVAAASKSAPLIPAAPGLPVVSAQATPAHSHLTGPSRDPFAGSASPAAVTTSTPAAATSSQTATSSNSSATHGSGGATSSSTPVSGGAPQAIATAPQSIIPVGTAPPKPAPGTLTPTQSYEVALAMTNSSGGLNTIDPLRRLSVIPSNQQPMLVELGVLKGGHRVMFAVQPGTVVGGPGVCTPGPIDCEMLSLAPGQTESLSQQNASGTNQVALFAITGISAVDDGSAAAAEKVRRQESAAGRSILDSSTLNALSLFRYDPSVGVVLDLRNLEVGGS